MNKFEAEELARSLARSDPEMQEAICELREQGASWLEICLRFDRAAKRIAAEVP